ncbi:MAG: MFS transporter [Promethearchaeota archaeon]|nr:MAG: MFS transporter [Candidatus Lokiarchaeota archaeon]
MFFNQYAADRIGRKIMLALTVAGMAIASLLIMISQNYIQYVIFVFLLNFFQLSDIWFLYINEESKKEKRMVYTNILLIGGISGAVIMVILRSIYITDTISNWRMMMVFPILLGIPLCIIILLTIKETAKYEMMKKEGIKKPKKEESFIKDVKSIFKTENRKPYTAILIMSAIYGGTTIYLSLFEKYISDVGSISQSQITLIFLWTILAVIVAYTINGILADRIGRKPLLYIWAALMPISVIIWVLGALTPYAYILVQVGYALTHVSYWGLLGIFRVTCLELVPTEKRGTALGFRSLLNALGITFGLLIASVLILFYGLGTTFIIFALVLFLLIPLNFLYGKETKGVDLSDIK